MVDVQLGIAYYEAATREMQDALAQRLPAFYQIAYELLGNSEDAEDAVQDTSSPLTRT